MSTDSRPPAILYDIRYSRFTGQLRPRPYAVLALTRASAMSALGIRRSAGAKVWPFLLVAAAFLPAVIAVGVPLIENSGTVESPLDVLTYYELLNIISILMVAYIATTIPSLLTRDRRDRVLTLYFSTALSASEYVIGKVLASLLLVLLVTLGPLLLLLVGGVVVADAPLDWAGDHADDLPKIVAAGLLVALFQSAIGLAIGSLTPRRVFAIGGYLALMLVPGVIGAVLWGVTDSRVFLALNLPTVPVNLAGHTLLELPDGAVTAPLGALWTMWTLVVLVGAGVLAWRYRGGRES